jgi:hypothetical protein
VADDNPANQLGGLQTRQPTCSFSYDILSPIPQKEVQLAADAPMSILSQCSAFLDTQYADTRECDPSVTGADAGAGRNCTHLTWDAKELGCSKNIDGFREFDVFATVDTQNPDGCLEDETKPDKMLADKACHIVTGTESAAGKLPNPLGISDVYQVIGLVIRLLTGVAGSIAMLGIVYGGFELITSGGDSKKVQKGKDVLTWSLLGLGLMLTAYLLANALFKFIEHASI